MFSLRLCDGDRTLIQAALAGLMVLFLDGIASGEEPISFRNEIAPILLEHCLACHGPKNAEGGYRLDSYAELLKPGDSGEAPIAPQGGVEQNSELLRRLSCDESERMPADAPALSAEQIELIGRWIAAGGVFDGQSAEQALSLVIPPSTYAPPPAAYAREVPVTACAFTPDGTQVIAGGYHELTLWDRSDGKLVRRISNLGERVFAMDFSADGKILAVACGQPGRSGEIRLLDYASGEVVAVVARSPDVHFDIAFRPGSNELAIASADNTIRIINVQSHEEVRTIAAHADWVSDVAWSDDGARLASASRDKTAKVYDGNSGELLVSYARHAAAVRGVAFVPNSLASDASELVSVGADNKMHRWLVADAKKTAEVDLGADASKLTRVADQLYVPCTDHRLVRIDLNNNQIAQQYIGHSDWVLAAAVWNNSDNHLLVSSDFDGQVRIWDYASGSVLQHWQARP